MKPECGLHLPTWYGTLGQIQPLQLVLHRTAQPGGFGTGLPPRGRGSIPTALYLLHIRYHLHMHSLCPGTQSTGGDRTRDLPEITELSPVLGSLGYST